MKKSQRYEHLATVEFDQPAYKGFYADIVFDHKEDSYCLWLGHDDYGCKDLMVGLAKHHTYCGKSLTETLESVMNAIPYHAEINIPYFIEDHMKGEL